MSEPIRLTLAYPNEKQQHFLECTAKYIAFGGARGGGKSWAVRTKAILLALGYAGIRLLIVRHTYQELESNHIRILRPQLAQVAEYKATTRTFTFLNGSTLEFGYCASDGDMDRYQGAEYDVIFLDECTQLREQWMRQFAACLRGVNDFPKRIYYTCNPGGPGHSYIKRLFIDRRFEPGENPDDYVFIPARVTDNKALLAAQPDYLKQLEALPRRLRQAWLEGRWDIFQGQVFSEFTDDPTHYADRRFTHVIPAFDIPREWRVYRSYDFGYAKPFSCGWWAVDHDNRRVAGWMQLHYRLAFDAEGYPGMYVFDTCRGFLRTVPALLYSDTDAEDVDTRQEDHIADETRYFCMSRPMAPPRTEAAVRPQDDPLDMLRNV